MNCVNYVIERIQTIGIPRFILELAFPNDPRFNNLNETLDYKMNERCIRYIIRDMNMLGGVVEFIRLSQCSIIYKDIVEDVMVVQVPEELTNFQPIINALQAQAIGHPGVPVLGNTYGNIGVTPAMLDANKISNTLSYGNVIHTARLTVLKDHIIQIQGLSNYYGDLVIKIERANNANLENIPANAYLTVYNLMLAGMKAYIYNNLPIVVSQGALYGGHDLSVVNDIVSGYSDASEMYNELLEDWRRSAFFTDPTQVSDYIRSLVGCMV